ncbi:hypothetical protein P691DRAFT_759309 [Macrolepiota fuliginosa MF-IS2]|uniref:Nucleolar protein 12 n=1 Tax=Macrolepiota fuliginosa MF-IS2 TaxID=1400762 RepID=A0A9P5XEY3_9AGAR|nr:hypothetical protein P691DRAFT_759309 [Macrolepiota fuliginosa MF-IS2]
MSLSSFLLKSTNNVDSELDALFKSQPPIPVPIATSTQRPETPSKKRKLDRQTDEVHAKRPKPETSEKRGNKESSVKASKKSKSKPKAKEPAKEEDEEDNSDLEATYLREKDNKEVDASPTKDQLAEEVESDEGEDDEDPSKLVHESLKSQSKSKSKRGPKQKYTPPDETSIQRDQRTIFIGNLSLEVAQKRPLQKQLQRHILSFIPTAKIESIRFRSIPFSAPTTNLPTPTDDSPSKPTPTTHKNPSQRTHDRTRANAWRSTNEGDDDATVKKDEKQHLNPNQKKKIAFINQEFHSTADTVHAYIVFAHPVSQDSRPKNLPPLEPVMNPYEAAREAVKTADETVWMERMIRVDFVGKNRGVTGTKPQDKGADDNEESVETSFADADPKLTLFVGNLDLASKEEDLRAFFESLMKTERGEPPEPEDQEESGEEALKKPRTWVMHVRIIRDKDTQLGKGFGYVQFTDRECVDELLTLDASQLKFAKRKLRIQRCKTIPGTKLPSSVKLNSQPQKFKDQSKSKSNTNSDKATKSQRAPPTPIIVPKGDPTLGQKLVNLSKEQRKKAKAADTDRVARRLAKKKARNAMGTSKDRAEGEQGNKKRERMRKGATGVLGGSKAQRVDGKKKGRIRSEKSLEKRNLKK